MKDAMKIAIAVGTITAAITGQYALCSIELILLLGYENYDLKKKLAAVKERKGG